ncbi:sialate O-acetylesterase [Sanyastnella coralliicola]|uniref:sialate O-acetylesterase n=1 Tax=Sanyastnella coralliicola TaxID=3069118 RepID=UPI0027BA7BA7|nr:sialate O-acetylesterase [Longitalea sp. SCSIO 12813]
MKSLLTFLGVLLTSLLFGQHHSTVNNELEDSGSEIVRVFVLAGQSNMQGHGKIYEGSNGAVGVVIASFVPDCLDEETEYCDFTFEMLDGFGDGWNGWTYDFVQDGNVVATETLENGSEGTAIVSLQNGVACDIVVNSAGGYGDEISWELISPSDDVVASMVGAEDDYPAPNTLLDVIENDEEGYWSMLQTDGDWSVFEGTHLYFENGDGTIIQDHVTIGQGAYPDLIGPELMFAVQMDQFYDDPVLIIKTAWGGLSLAEDFRPPSAGGNTGFYYNEMIDRVAYVTENMQALFPDIGTDQFEITGFGWFQGWNDAGSDDFLNEYESNLHHLVNDVRNDLGNPELPFVIASSGQGGYEDHWGWTQDIQDIIAVAQEAVGCDDETYGGTVGFVDTKPLYIAASESPDDAGFHFHNNARTFLNVGKFMGDEMILAIGDMAFCSEVSVDETNLSMNEVSVYPNPASHVITVDLSLWNQGNARMKCYDLKGKVLIDQPIQMIGSFDVSSFAEGMYVIELDSAEGVYRERVVVR